MGSMVSFLYRGYDLEIKEHDKCAFTFIVKRDGVIRKKGTSSLCSIELVVDSLREYINRIIFIDEPGE